MIIFGEFPCVAASPLKSRGSFNLEPFETRKPCYQTLRWSLHETEAREENRRAFRTVQDKRRRQQQFLLLRINQAGSFLLTCKQTFSRSSWTRICP